jgi:hypothetical protein
MILLVSGPGERVRVMVVSAAKRLGAVERLDSRSFVDREDDGMGGRFDIKPNNIAQLVDELRVVESLNWWTRCGWRPCVRQMRWTELALISTAFVIIVAVQWVASAGGSVRESATTRLSAFLP